MAVRKAKKKGAKKAPEKKAPAKRSAPKTRTITCKTPGCTNRWTEPVRSGRLREYCLERCSPERHLTRDLGRLDDIDRALSVERAREEMGQRIELASRPLRVAMALAQSKDPPTVAALAGVDPASDELPALIEEAERLFPEVVEGRPQAIQQLCHAAVGQSIVSAAFRAHLLTPQGATTAAKNLTQAVTNLQSGGAARSFSQIQVIVRGLGHDNDEDLPELEPASDEGPDE